MQLPGSLCLSATHESRDLGSRSRQGLVAIPNIVRKGGCWGMGNVSRERADALLTAVFGHVSALSIIISIGWSGGQENCWNPSSKPVLVQARLTMNINAVGDALPGLLQPFCVCRAGCSSWHCHGKQRMRRVTRQIPTVHRHCKHSLHTPPKRAFMLPLHRYKF